MAAKVFFVTGKGGVGKSTLANAMAQSLGMRGLPTLLLEVPGFSALPAQESSRESLAHFTKERLQLHHVVEEYFFSQLKKMTPIGTLKKISDRFSGEVAKHLLANRFVLKFVEACPGLAPTVFLGKICAEAREGKNESGQRWDYIVVDAPSTGQSLQLFESAKILSHVLSTGMVFRHIRDTLDYARSPNFHIEIVTLAEPGPLQECREMIARLKAVDFTYARMWINRIVASKDREAFREELRTSEDGLKAVIEDEVDRADYETREIELLRQEFRRPLQTIDDLDGKDFDAIAKKIGQLYAREFAS